MRVIKTILVFVILFVCLSFRSNNQYSKLKATSYDLDYILDYIVKVDPRIDGTLDISINIKWKVLDDYTEGPLEWVKVGIPNCYVDNIVANTSNISKIKYLSDSGSYIRIDFVNEYYKDDVIGFSFSFHQSRMYFLDGNNVYYDYNPGYFDTIKVGNMQLYWNATNVIDCNITDIQDGYYVISKELNYSETLKIKAVYDKSSFNNLSKKLQYSSRYMTTKDILIIVACVSCVFIGLSIIVISNMKNYDYYSSNRGFVRSYHHPYIFRRYHSNTVNTKGKPIVANTSNGSSGGHSCACACACAGGGRAGCSVKDFYQKNINSNKVIDSIEREERE